MKRFLVLAALSAAIAAAQTNLGEVKTYLELSDTQLSSLRQIRDTMRNELRPIRQEIQAKAKALRDQNQAGSNAATALGQMMIDLRNARKQIEPLRMRAHDQAMAVLTPSQRAKLDELKASVARRREFRQAARLGLLDPGAASSRSDARRRRL